MNKFRTPDEYEEKMINNAGVSYGIDDYTALYESHQRLERVIDTFRNDKEYEAYEELESTIKRLEAELDAHKTDYHKNKTSPTHKCYTCAIEAELDIKILENVKGQNDMRDLKNINDWLRQQVIHWQNRFELKEKQVDELQVDNVELRGSYKHVCQVADDLKAALAKQTALVERAKVFFKANLYNLVDTQSIQQWLKDAGGE